MICKLCNINEANQTGSHIVPHFLLKRIDNEEGSTKRDKELGFVLSEAYPTSYFGRSTSKKKLDEVYGELSDEQIAEKSQRPLVEDYILCVNCEKRLSSIESYYADTLGKTDEENSQYATSEVSFLGFLFWSSIIWRLSIGTFSGFSLLQRDESQLRQILDKYLHNNVNQVASTENDPLLRRIGYKLMRSYEYSKVNPTILFCHPHYARPYFFIIDEFALIFYFNKHDLQRSLKLFPSIPFDLCKAKFNTPHENEIILSVGNEVFNKVKTNFYEELTYKFLGNFSQELDEIHNRLGGTGRMPMSIKQQIASQMINDDTRMGIKYTIEHKAQSIFKVLKHHIK